MKPKRVGSIPPELRGRLAEILVEARQDRDRETAVRLRSCAFLLIDYYQVALVAGAQMIRRKLRGGLGLDAMAVIFAALHDFPPEDVHRIEELRKLRNDLSHDADFVPEKRVLDVYLERAEATANLILEGAFAAKTRLDSMEGFPREVAETLLAIEPWVNYSDDKEYLNHLLNQGKAITERDAGTPTLEEIRTYAELVAALSEVERNRDLDYQDQAAQAAYDYHRGK